MENVRVCRSSFVRKYLASRDARTRTYRSTERDTTKSDTGHGQWMGFKGCATGETERARMMVSCAAGTNAGADLQTGVGNVNVSQPCPYGGAKLPFLGYHRVALWSIRVQGAP